MIKNKTYVTDEICSHIWLNPIKSSGEGVQKIGLEMEMHAYDAQTLHPLGTSNSKITPQILMERIVNCVSQSKVTKDANSDFISMVSLPQGYSFSLEPGGQVEFSSAPCENLSSLAKQTQEGLLFLEEVAKKEVVFFSHGSNPVAQKNHPLILPKKRYEIMTRYFESASQLRGIDMMRQCATVQLNLDVFGDKNWKEAVHLMIVLIPLTQYLFANSAYFKNKRSAYLSERQAIWSVMDPTRSGFPFLDVEKYFSQCPECEYAKWAKNANVFYIEDLPVAEQPLYNELPFYKWMSEGYKGTKPTINDWQTHLGTLFPHLRLRKFLEVRHIDAQPFEHTFAPIAFFTALIQTSENRKKTWELIRSFHFQNKKLFSKEEITYSHIHEPLLDLAAKFLLHSGENEGFNSLVAYKKFLGNKENYWTAASAAEFLKVNESSSPGEEFVRNLFHQVAF